jgi:kynurenine formamidase
VNFRDIYFNPHGHVTHTECLGHITKDLFSINKAIKEFFCHARLISITPETFYNPADGRQDRIIRAAQVANALKGVIQLDALIIRTLPNSNIDKFHRSYSNTNPPYLEPKVVDILNQLEVKHLLVDLPSVDRESDEGKLAFHHCYWSVPENPDQIRTITELIFVDESIDDGAYILELQLAPFENDASPSRPVLYRILKDPI